MGFSYKPLLRLLLERNMKKTDLLTEAGLSSATLAKVSKGEPLSGESIEKLCVYFRCQPGELVEYIWDDAAAATAPSASASAAADAAAEIVSTAKPAQSVQPPKEKKIPKRAVQQKPSRRKAGS